MRAQPTDHAKFTAWRESNAQNLNLPLDWKELSCKDTLASELVWKFEWYLSCGPDKYVRIWERYERWPKLLGASRRASFVYHYGALVGIGKDGNPTYNPKNPVDIRIDNINRPYHMHFGAPDPHHDQSVIKGLTLEDMDMFEFLNGIIRHRSNNKPLNKIFGFTIG
jgi:hypothetical protein